jgi:two-component system sensor histidine kinase QseC
MTVQRSLFRRLLGGFFMVMLLIWLAVVAMAIYDYTVMQARRTAAENKGWTRQILLNLQSIADDPAEVARVAGKVEALRTDMLAEVNYWPRPTMLQVWVGNARVYSTAGGLPNGMALPAPDAPRLGNDWSTWTERDATSGVIVRRDAMHDANWLLTGSGATYFIAPLLYCLPFLMLPAWLIVRRGLRPLKSIVNAIEERSGSDLSPLLPSPYRELSPLVASVNSLMQRLTARVERDKEFLSDAAHELKTPLSVIQANAHLLLQHQNDPLRMGEADEGLRLGVARATHTVHQLLALERARSDQEDSALEPADLTRLLRERLALAAPLAMHRNVEIELDAATACVLPLHRESAVALLDNLISNAVKYSPDGGTVKATLSQDGQGTELRIHDEGPGIPPALRNKVFERFYRIPGQEQPGSGLGLAIAERAAHRNGATITFQDRQCGQGLLAIVRFGAGKLDAPS